MKKTFAKLLVVFLAITIVSCKSDKKENNSDKDADFASFETKFLDAYWKQYPSGAIAQGYGKYYDKLVVPNAAAFADNVKFSKKWLADLQALDYDQLSDKTKSVVTLSKTNSKAIFGTLMFSNNRNGMLLYTTLAVLAIISSISRMLRWMNV